MSQCCIEGCVTSPDKDVTYFEFPTSRLVRKRWLEAIGCGKLAGEPRLCSRHFAPHEYEHVRGKTRLRGKVLPTLCLYNTRTPKLPKDPLATTGSSTEAEESQESTADKESTNTDNYIKNCRNNEKVDINIFENYGELSNISKENGLNVEENHNNEVLNSIEKIDENIDKQNEIVENCNEMVGKPDEIVDDLSKTIDKINEILDHCNEAVDVLDEKVDNRNETVDKQNEIVDNRNEDVDNVAKVDTSSTEVVTDEDNGRRVGKRAADRPKNKRVKKKWVPMRPRLKENGHASEDSTSQDSINSNAHVAAPPLLEDLEEHLPNYQIANMKTERQVAAMTDTVGPIEDILNPIEDVEEITVEPHVPVFIELSVGQDNLADSSEQTNDCLMVMESVQCDIDPTLMLEARAEDEECTEHIDLSDDDDDVVALTEPIADDKKTKKPIDPISLLTSSDEDDVILQEPHIDTLSVSDETDEDDLPLQKLIKREKKAKKKKKKEAIKSILVAPSDFYCTYCQNVSTTRSEHEKHVKTHLIDEPSQGKTRVFQICKECGFTSTNKSQLNRHQKKHLNERRFKCPLCSYRSKYNMSLMYHLKTHDFDPNMYNCGACGLELGSRKELLDHQSVCYAMNEKFRCGVCGYVAQTKRTLKSHKSTVHKRKS